DRGNDRVIRLSSSQGTQCVRDDGDSCTVAPGDTSCTVECVLPTACTGPSCTCVTASGRSCAVATNTDRCTVAATTCTLDNSKRYLDRDAGTCDEESAGCREFLRIEQTNRVANGSFEYLAAGSAADDAAEDTFMGWTETPAGSIVGFATSNAFFGTTTLEMRNNGTATDRMRFPFNSGYAADGRTFTLSVYGRTAVAGVTCTTRVGLSSLLLAGVENGVTADVDLTSDWQRFFLTYTVPQDGRRNDVIVSLYEDSAAGACAAGTTMLLDGVQVEETATVTNYKDYGSAGGVTLTEERKACVESEAGCEEYTSTSTGERIPGVVRPGDQCPADQVGCKGYREEPLQSFPTRPARDYINPPASISYLDPFITPTARSCSAQYEGCAEYTNLDIVEQGGEGREYYTDLRLCVLPDDPAADIESFYSWSGSATTGFQLNVHQLLGSNTDNGPCSNVNQAVQPFNTCDDGNFPDLNQDGLANDRDCQPLYGDNPDCQEYFDASGTVYYRYRSRTVTSSDDCHPLRETEKRCLNAAALNHYCSTDAECGAGGDCESVIFHAIPSENVSCPAGFAGCREYRGNTGGNSQVVFRDDFEDGDTVGWTGGVIITNESLQFGGHSATTGNQAIVDVSNIVREGGTYELSLWGKRAGGANSIMAVTGTGGCHAALPFLAGPAIPLTDQWQKITIGPFRYGTAPCSDETIWITTLTGWYFDNVELREITDNLYFIHDSWTTCDAANVGCDRYRDRQGRDRFISSFTSLCREEAIGCEAVVDTQNSSNPYAQTFRSGQPAEVIVPDDAIVYRVNDPKKYCQSTEKGCARLGTPSIGADGLVSDWQTTYRIDDPDQYDATLCGHLETGCQEYTTDEGAIQYFRSPTGAQCSYRENITVGENAPPASGWYKTSTTSGVPDCPIRSSSITPDGIPKSICANSGDPAVDGQDCTSDEDCRSGGVLAGTCQYWVGSCPGAQSTCALFTDRQDPEQDGNYTYLAKSVVADACPEGVNTAAGCVPFYTENEGDTSVRSSGDLGEQTTAPSGCRACSFDQNVCGYDGETPCCNFQVVDPASGESCSVFASDADPAGTPAAVRYCLNDGTYPLPPNEVALRTCLDDAAAPGACVVADNPAIPTNCGGASQPVCCSGPDTVQGTQDDSEDVNRLCTDFGCDANIVLSVNQDRECAAWLACSDSQQVERTNGDIEQVCFARKLCRAWADGRCADPDE
ncbi:MAG: hypothetical protein HY341_02695, partial [Candidatus Kerfeldbacteria bacterium]|nr:hypothetical protein [Candidatus Kerfeldbacteria bacterium]